MSPVRIGPWTIRYDPPPIPIRSCDYAYTHEDYDGPGDDRHGYAASVEDALKDIAEIEDGRAA